MSDAPPICQIVRCGPKSVPLIVSVPHAGTYLPPMISKLLTPEGLGCPDTDWHVDKLYDFVPTMGGTLIVATHSRIVADLNRDPAGDVLYAGASNTELCPTSTFFDAPIYRAGLAPDRTEIAMRIAQYWHPYHRQLLAEIARLKARHGYCVLLDGHSIVSEVPRFFAGRLADLNLGTADGKSCAAALTHAAFQSLSQADGFTAVHNGRFKGGHITRHYGDPANDVHALQLEMALRCYLDEAEPQQYDAARAAPLKAVLKSLVDQLLHWKHVSVLQTNKQDHC